MADDDIRKMTFEQAIAELEAVVKQLDNGDVPLEASIALYDRGAKLKKRCELKLREAEEKVEQITLDARGAPTGTVPAEDM